MDNASLTSQNHGRRTFLTAPVREKRPRVLNRSFLDGRRAGTFGNTVQEETAVAMAEGLPDALAKAEVRLFELACHSTPLLAEAIVAMLGGLIAIVFSFLSMTGHGLHLLHRWHPLVAKEPRDFPHKRR
jgi:hypothetical protein